MIIRKRGFSIKVLMLFMGMAAYLSSCEDKYDKIEKFQRPEWLVGKVYTQIAQNPELTLFAQCIADVGYDEIIDKSGTYTAFAPSNEAFEAYLNENAYGSIDAIPYDVKMELVKFHLIQMPWNREQLQSLSSQGWINMYDVDNNKPYAFKRQSLLKKANKNYPVKVEKDGVAFIETIVPESESDEIRTVYANSRKYTPLYFDGFLAASELSGNDYSFYFDRNYEAGNIYFGGGKTVGEEIFADNGFIYMIDKVMKPLLNAEELMEQEYDSYAYSDFKYLIYLNSEFTRNQEATQAQEGYEDGLEVDQLYDLSYPKLAFDIHQELNHPLPASFYATQATTENHYGILVPTNEAFQAFVDEVLTGSGKWAGVEDMPGNVRTMIANTHMAQQPIYLKDITEGFFNALGDFITIDPSSIIQKNFGSNATFLGLNKVIVPKAFSSVSAPMYLNPDYLTYSTALDYTDLLPALKNDKTTFTLFALNEQTLADDQSLMVIWKGWNKDRYDIRAYDWADEKFVTRDRAELSNTLFGHIGIEAIVGVARKEFLETLNGRHMVLNNQENTIADGEFGYNKDSSIVVNFTRIPGDFYNGEVYNINGWIKYPAKETHTLIEGTQFLELLKKAGLADNNNIKMFKPTDVHTIFVPSDRALAEVMADTLTGDNLKAFLKYHFIKGEFIFTDGKKAPGLYKTMSRVQSDEGYLSQEMHLVPGIDELSILNSEGALMYKIVEEENVSNIIGAKPNGAGTFPISGAVIHKIDAVLIAN